MGLADKIAEANEREDIIDGASYPIDDLGLPILPKRPDYIAVRILKRNDTEYRAGKAPLLHTRNNKRELWLGHDLLVQDVKTLYKLAHTDQKIDAWMVPIVYDMLCEHTYHLDTSKFIVDEEHYWDKETGELKKIEGEMPAITPVRRR